MQRGEDKRPEVLRKKVEKEQEAVRKKAEKEEEAARKKSEKEHEASRKKAEVSKKRKDAAGKQKEKTGNSPEINKYKRSKLRISKDEQARRDEHERCLRWLREDAEKEYQS